MNFTNGRQLVNSSHIEHGRPLLRDAQSMSPYTTTHINSIRESTRLPYRLPGLRYRSLALLSSTVQLRSLLTYPALDPITPWASAFISSPQIRFYKSTRQLEPTLCPTSLERPSSTAGRDCLWIALLAQSNPSYQTSSCRCCHSPSSITPSTSLCRAACSVQRAASSDLAKCGNTSRSGSTSRTELLRLRPFLSELRPELTRSSSNGYGMDMSFSTMLSVTRNPELDSLMEGCSLGPSAP